MTRAAGLSLFATLLILAAGGWLALAWQWHPDVAFYTTAARQLAGGAVLYRDIGDVNAPPIYWLHQGLQALASLGGWDERPVLVASYLAVAALLLFWTAALLRPLGSRGALCLPPLLAMALSFAALGVFGEREHWATLLILPHLAAMAVVVTRPEAPPRRWQALAAGALAGAACLLKPPFFLCLLLLPELWLAWQRRRWRSLWRGPALAAAAAFAGGAALAWALHPLFFTRVLPDALQFYSALGKPLLELLRPRGIWLPLALLLWALCLAPWLAPASRRAQPFLLAALGGVGAYLLQGKGFGYHWLPVLVTALAGVVLLLASGGAGWRRLLLVPLVLLPLWIGFLGWQQTRGTATAWPQARALAAVLRPGEGVFGLNPELFPLFPAVTQADARWLGNEPALWQLDGLYRADPAPEEATGFRPPARQDATESALRRDLVQRFLASRPELVAVLDSSDAPAFGGSPFRYLDYFLADPDFAAAWQGYRLDVRIGDYDLYRRRAP